jgi:acetylglutamate kinase
MKILIKLGGTLLDGDATRQAIATQLAAARKINPQTVIVHGGGKQMTRFLAERNVESKFVEGLRVTSEEVLDAVLKVFAGSVNHQLVASLIAAGAPAVGITGIDACLAEAEQLRPVVACVAGDRNGQIYNVNADQMAVSCASGFQADRLLFLTDVDGVKDGSGQVIPTLSLEQSRLLIADGIATGGMQAKLNAAADALLGGVGEVVIAPGAAPDIVARLLGGEAVGTRFVRS